MIAQAALPSTFAHEIGHTLGFGHAPCSPPGEALPDNIDPRLPGHTEDVGLDVQSLQLIPAGIGEVMSYCDDERSWPSIVFWNSSFDLFTLKVG
jgi:hypothetical protein